MILLALAAAAAGPAYYQSSPERRIVVERSMNQWEAAWRAKLVPSLMQDFGEKYLYAAANAVLPPPQPGKPRVIFIGDSITDLWNLSQSFPGKDYINRGIGSQVTAQILVRFHQDVIALRPAAVVILVGINDVQGGLQKESDEGIKANWEAMAEMADAHHVKLVFGSILPVNNYSDNARNMLAERDPNRIEALNRWLAAFCKRGGHALADYHRVMADDRHLLQADLTRDGLHPLSAGYARMAPVVEAAITRALARNRKPS